MTAVLFLSLGLWAAIWGLWAGCPRRVVVGASVKDSPLAPRAVPAASDPRVETEHLGLPLPRSHHNPLPRHDDGDSVLSGCYRDNKVCPISLGHVFSIPAYVDPVKAYGDGRPDRY